jgi:hypothetical protein
MVKSKAWFPTNVIKMETVHTGGNVYLDIIHLINGKVVIVSDDCVCVYPSIKFFEDGEYEGVPCIHFTEVPE